MKTTVEIPDALFRRAKAQAALPGIRLRDLMVRDWNWLWKWMSGPFNTRRRFPSFLEPLGEWSPVNTLGKRL